MTPEIILVLSILAVAVVLFVSERIRVDLVALLVLITLALTGLVTTEEAFSGFASPAVITVWSVYIVSGALFRSGVADILARFMLRIAGTSYIRILIVIMLTVGLMSSFMNNIGAVAILLPAAVSVARRIRVPPSKLLMPMAFTSLLGGGMTLIGTPPNILATSIMETYGGMEGFGFFDFTPMGAIVLVTGVLYFIFIGRHLLPDRAPGGDLSQVYQVREYMSEVRVRDSSSLIGQTLAESQLGSGYELDVLQVRRVDRPPLNPAPETRIRAGDVLSIQGSSDNLLRAGEALGLEALVDWKFDDPDDGDSRSELEMVEITLSPQSHMKGHTLKEVDFRARTGLSVLAIQRRGKALVSKIADIALEYGDALLIRGPRKRINDLRADPEYLVLETAPLESRRLNKAPIAVLILAGVLVLVTTRVLHVSTAMLIGAVLMVLLKVLDMDEAIEAIEWKSVFLIAGMLPMGIAMQTTGTAQFLAGAIVDLVGDMGPLAVVMGIFLMTALTTEVMSNAAAAVLVTPIAIDAARSLGANPQAFVMAVVIAAATSFLMPIGHQANVLVFGPGGYRFLDYTRVGLWLNLIIFVVVAIFLPLIWPLGG
ncbi:MAG TPA: SLC13 family permease [Anaerolineales bacterium]|nr:SLC13 family permease [Anaerolineales bacterium]